LKARVNSPATTKARAKATAPVRNSIRSSM
jgi:hypothetical protein